MNRSIRLRMTALVACTFAAVLVASSMVFLGWFERQLVDEVRADDNLELDRQVEIIVALAVTAEQISGFVTSDDLFEPMSDDDFPVAIIPDDGTSISISNADGLELTNSAASFRILTSDVSSEGDPPNEADADAANELNAILTETFFGFDEQEADSEARVITTTRGSRILDLPVLITATTRDSSIDAALDNVTRTLWIAVPVLVALAAGLTFLATGRALQPVDAMTKRVESITSTRSGDRVPEPGTGDEINQLAVTMNGMLDRLEASALSQRQFVSDVSHELRTPAAVIRAEVEAGLADKDNDWPTTAESVLAEQARLTELVDDLLLLAQMDEGDNLRRTDIDLDALLQDEARRGWTHAVGAKAVEPVRIRGDERQLARVIQNLVANANRHADSRVELTLRIDGGYAVLWVDDDGAGVPGSERERVFERFARLDESRRRDRGGSGLGLAIVREVAQAHGGSASVTNSPLGGARVEVSLPT